MQNSAAIAPNAAQGQSRPILLCQELGLWTLLQPQSSYPSQREKDPNSPSVAAWGLRPTPPGLAREGLHTAGCTKALWDKRLPKDTSTTPTFTPSPKRTRLASKLLLDAAAAPFRGAPPRAESHSPEWLCPGGKGLGHTTEQGKHMDMGIPCTRTPGTCRGSGGTALVTVLDGEKPF